MQFSIKFAALFVSLFTYTTMVVASPVPAMEIGKNAGWVKDSNQPEEPRAVINS